MNLPTAFDQSSTVCRCEWGTSGLDALAPADVVIVVDALSFSTCVDIATGRGASILPYPWKGTAAEMFAHQQGAQLAGPRGIARYSLSPASFLDAERGLRCVLPSPNGAELTRRAAETSAVVLAGCFRNAAAVASAAQQCGRTFNVCPAGERWSDGSLRPAIEDWLAAGAIIASLQGSLSPEAAAAKAAFERLRENLPAMLAASSSGRELIERGYGQDVELAAQLNVSSHVARFIGGAFSPAVNSRSL